MNRNQMKCPVCRSALKITGQEQLETLADHVFDPNGFPPMRPVLKCSDTECITHQHNIRWNEDGEIYGYIQGISFIDGNNGPFGSLVRRINVEVNKKDENKWFKLPFNWTIELHWIYKADDDGNILSRRPILKFWHNHILHISGIHMIIFCLRQHYKHIEDPDSDDFNYPFGSFRKDWWRWVVPFILRIIDRKTYLQYKKAESK